MSPALAIVDVLRKRGPCEAVLLGTSRRGEQALLADSPVEGIPIYLGGRGPLDHVRAFKLARTVLKQRRPDAVIGLGGYPSIAGVMAARSRRHRVVLLEQNAVPGRANEMLAKLGCGMLAGVESAPDHSSQKGDNTTRLDVVGTPVRTPIASLASASPMRHAACREILLLGGSQGAQSLSRAFLDAVELNIDLLGKWKIAHQAPADDVADVEDFYRTIGVAADVRPFFDDVPARLARGPLVVSRAGGSTIAELACAGVPTLLVPHAAALRDHQLLNAGIVTAAGGGLIVEEHELHRLAVLFKQLLRDPLRRCRMATAIRSLARPEAAANVVERLGLVPGPYKRDHRKVA